MPETDTGIFTYAQSEPDTSFVGKLLRKRKFVIHTQQWSSVNVALGPGQLWVSMEPSVPNPLTCLYCERTNPPERYQCDGCGASLHQQRQ